jgi:hypothetical protein
MNVFGEVWTAHRSLSSLGTNSKGQTLRFYTKVCAGARRIIG